MIDPGKVRLGREHSSESDECHRGEEDAKNHFARKSIDQLTVRFGFPALRARCVLHDVSL
jgi:hypothetical protein